MRPDDKYTRSILTTATQVPGRIFQRVKGCLEGFEDGPGRAIQIPERYLTTVAQHTLMLLT
jgi:hypothetical protein